MIGLTDEQIAAWLTSARLIAVVGLSSDKSRPSYGVARYLQDVGYRIVPVNPKHAGELILDELVVSTLAEIPERIDIVDLFRRRVDVPRPVREAIQAGATGIWMQLGISNEESALEAASAGLLVVQDRCIAVEHRRLIGR